MGALFGTEKMAGRTSFGMIQDGREAGLYWLANKRGLQIAVSDYGATLVQLAFPDRDGVVRDLVLGYDSVAEYEKGTQSFGATVGRVANRIGKGKFIIHGIPFQLTVNNGPNTLHGGRDFYVKRLWKVAAQGEASVTFVLDSPDGDQGFPGNLHIAVTYTVTKENEVRIHYEAQADQDTPINLTNHSYFNLGGHDSGSVLNQTAQIHARQFTKNDKDSLPTGEFVDVKKTPMDFCTPKPLEQDIKADYEALLFGNGYDHNYIIAGEGFREAAVLYCEKTGIRMSVKTDLPGVQLYTANYLENEIGKQGVVYQARDGVCFETQFYPDAINKEHFPGGILKAGEKFSSETSYGFSIKNSRGGHHKV